MKHKTTKFPLPSTLCLIQGVPGTACCLQAKVAKMNLSLKNLTAEIAIQEDLTMELHFPHELNGSFAIDFKGQRIGP